MPYMDLSYKTFGTLNAAGDNCILVPTSFTTTHAPFAWLVGRARALNPAKYFIVVPNLLGNGLSSSPSNIEPPFNGAEFPEVTITDNVQLQYSLLRDILNVKQIALIYGWSMGAMQAYVWAATYPAMVQRLLTVCGSAKCWPLNDLRLEGAAAALKTDPDFRRGNYDITPQAGLRAFVRFAAGWAYSAAFYRNQLYRNIGFETVEEMLSFADNFYSAQQVEDLLAMLWTWRSANMEPDVLRKITAQTIVMPCESDLYVSIDDVRIEAAQISNAELRVINSDYGHCAGSPGWVSSDAMVLEKATRDLLAR